jgi:hypothetical protein
MNPYCTHPGFPSRVTHAERCLKLLAEGRDRRTSSATGETYSVASDRKFDNCFEMYDGDAVVWELMRRAKFDPVLMRGIERSCGNAAALQHWYRIAGYKGQQLTLGL